MTDMNGSVLNITCPHCGENFAVNASEYQSVADQLKAQIGDRIAQEAKAAQEEAVKTALDKAKADANIVYLQLKEKYEQAKAANEQEIKDLRHKADLAEQDQKLAVQRAVAAKEQENARLVSELQHAKEMAASEIKAAGIAAEGKIRDLEAKNQREKDKIIAAADAEIAKKDLQIAEMNERAKTAETAKNLAVKSAQESMTAALQKKETELLLLKGELETQIQAAKLQGNMQKEQYETALRLKDEEIQRIKDFKARLSTKALGESLEQYCQNQFNAIRTTAFPNAYFEKDNDARSGSKGDYIYRETVGDIEILSIMFDMKTEADTTATKKRNEDYFKELDKDRNEKKCEYAVLVSTLEADNDFYNAGIQDVSFRYPKMYVCRPQQFIALISLLRNAAMNSLECQKELALIKSQQLDLVNFEKNMQDFKDSFGRNYRLASDKLKAAVDGIDRTIASLQKTRDNLLASDNQLRLANDKAEDLSIKKMTKNAPSVAAKLTAISKVAKSVTEPRPEKNPA